MDALYSSIAQQGLLRIFIVLVSIVVTWWCLKVVRFDIFFRNIQSVQSKLLQLILAIVIGYQLGKFFIDYLEWTSTLKGLF